MVRGDSGHKIFVCYRRGDSQTHVANLYQRLESHFGNGAVFLDKTSIKGGSPVWDENIKPTLEGPAAVMLVVFGKNWIHERDEGGRGPSLYVLEELRIATERNAAPDRAKIQFIPVTVDGAELPNLHEVDKSLHPVISSNNAVALTVAPGDPPNHVGVIHAIEEALERHQRSADEIRLRSAKALIEGKTVVDGNYEIKAWLGEGELGTVYRAEDVTDGRKAAVKVLHRELIVNGEMVERFMTDARTANALHHPGIARIMHAGQLPTTGARYLVSECLEGSTLAYRLGQLKPRLLSVAEVIDYASQAADALRALHLKGVFHGDLKPENIFLVLDEACPHNERVKILDFGLAKFLAPRTSHTTTMAGSIRDTLAYMAPEQREARKIDRGAADIYSLGAVLFEMVFGKPPSDKAQSEAVLLFGGRGGATPPPWSIDRSIQPELEAVILKALATEKEDRFASMDALLVALKAVPPPPSPPPLPPSLFTTTLGHGAVEVVPGKGRGASVWVAMAAGAVVVSLAAVLVPRQAVPPPPPPPPPPREQVRIRINSQPVEAVVTNLDDKSTLGLTPIVLPHDRGSGKLRVSIKKEHFKEERHEISLGRDFDQTFPLTAEPVTPPVPPAHSDEVRRRRAKDPYKTDHLVKETGGGNAQGGAHGATSEGVAPSGSEQTEDPEFPLIKSAKNLPRVP